MRTPNQLWAMHPPAVAGMRGLSDYLNSVEADQKRARADMSDEERKARSDPMRGQVRMGSAADAERNWYPINVVGRSALVHISGVMIKGLGSYGGVADTLEIRRAFEAAASDPDIDDIVLRFDTPGGSVDGLAELGDTVWQIRNSRAKPVIAQVDGMCCSAGYYVASQADEIRSARMDVIGSIGTRMLLYDWHVLFENEGIEAVPIDTGKYKSTGAMGTEITAEQRAFLQDHVDQYFADFKAMITRGRPAIAGKLNTEQTGECLADGRWWTAPEALKLGLIDKIQGLDETLLELQSKATNATARTGTARARLQLMEMGAQLAAASR